MKNSNKKLFMSVIMVLTVGLMMLSLGACKIISYQPLSTEPIENQPVPTQPVVTQPAPTQGAPTQPVVTQAAPTQPVVTQPIATQPTVTESEPSKEVEVLTFYASADAETRSGDTSNPGPADQNFGTNAKVTYIKGASNERRGFMMFNVEGIGASEVKSAKLLVYYASKGGGDPVGSTQVYLTETNWSEETMTHNTQPALGEMVAEYSNEGMEVGQWKEIDVTEYVKADGTYSYAFVGKESSVRLDFASKEFTDPAMQPSLVIEK